MVILEFFRRPSGIILILAALLGACASKSQITNTQALSDAADAPYNNILVVTLYSKFDSRRYFEQELVKRLTEKGVTATASTSLMDTKTPVNRETFVAMVKKLDADAVILTQMSSLRTTGKVVNMNPQMTYNLRPTGYYNVFTADVTEYVEPAALDYEHFAVLLTDVYSAKTLDTVWGIQSSMDVKVKFDQLHDFSIMEKEVGAIVSHLTRDGLLAK
jgi:hypothetical protein